MLKIAGHTLDSILLISCSSSVALMIADSSLRLPWMLVLIHSTCPSDENCHPAGTVGANI